MKLKLPFLSMAVIAASFMACNTNPSTDVKNRDVKEQTSIENIMTRTSVRQFTNRVISKDTIEILLKAGMAAPSAINKQPWDFIVVTEREVLDSLLAQHPHSNLKTATAAIVVCGNMQQAIEGEGQGYWIQDCSAATENILLAAHSLGLGAVWCGVYPVEERVEAIKGVLKLPSYIIPLNIISMGYPANAPEPKDKWNPAKVHYQQW